MIDRNGTDRDKQRKADDLLTGLIFHRTDLGAIGETLVRLLLSSTVNSTKFVRRRLHQDQLH
jgi:hypothetical protein